MTNRSKFRVGKKGHAFYFAVAPGFQTSVIALATIWDLQFKNGVYDNGEKFWESGKNFVMATQAF